MTTTIRLLVLTALLAAAPAGRPADALDLNNPTGSRGLVLIDKIGRHIRWADPATHQPIGDIEVGPAPHDFALSSDHRTLYVPIYGDGIYGRNPHPGHEIAVIDLESRRQVGVIDVAPYQAPHGIQIDANGLLYVTCDLSRTLLIVDPRARRIEAAIDTEGTGHWLALLPDGSKAYVANKNDRPFISVIDIRARRMVGRIPAPNGTQGIVASPDGTRVIAVDYAEPQLLVIDPATDALVETIALEGRPRAYKARYSPDGRLLLVCSAGQGQVNILDAANLHGRQHVVPVGRDPMGFAFSADGRVALVANHGDGSISVIDLRAAKVVETFRGGAGVETLTYY